MRLEEYVSERVRSAVTRRVSRMDVLRELHQKTGVSLSTLRHVDNGMRLAHYGRAAAIAAATGDKVTVVDLCSPAS